MGLFYFELTNNLEPSQKQLQVTRVQHLPIIRKIEKQ